MSFNYNAVLLDETMMNLAREMIENTRPVEDVIKEWQEQVNAVIRGKKKDKVREMLERKWDGFFTHPQTNKPLKIQKQDL